LEGSGALRKFFTEEGSSGFFVAAAGLGDADTGFEVLIIGAEATGCGGSFTTGDGSLANSVFGPGIIFVELVPNVGGLAPFKLPNLLPPETEEVTEAEELLLGPLVADF